MEQGIDEWGLTYQTQSETASESSSESASEGASESASASESVNESASKGVSESANESANESASESDEDESATEQESSKWDSGVEEVSGERTSEGNERGRDADDAAIEPETNARAPRASEIPGDAVVTTPVEREVEHRRTQRARNPPPEEMLGKYLGNTLPQERAAREQRAKEREKE